MFLSPEIILEGYNKGLFPMADSYNDPFVYWVDPKERGIIKKFVMVTNKATYLIVCKLFPSDPFIKKRNKDPIDGSKIIEDKIGKSIN